MRKAMKNEITLSVKSISDMQKYIIMVNGDFLLSLDARERTDLCNKLLEEIEKFPELKAPSCWPDCVRNPGIWNTQKFNLEG
jgi:hypothetical protein